jgi:hypothetical protein
VRTSVYGEQIIVGMQPLAPIEFELPVVDYVLQFERV